MTPDDLYTEHGMRVALVTGPAGAGRSTALDALEDLGFEAIDNLPLRLVPPLLEGHESGALALGVDTRTRDFGTGGLSGLLARLRATRGLAVELVFLDCADAALSRRFAETRRAHPLAPDAPPEEGIARERAALAPIRDIADILVDTSELSPGDLRGEIARLFAGPSPGPTVTLVSFSYKRGIPRGADLVFDCRFLANPHWDPSLRPLDGRAPEVAAHVTADPGFMPFMARLNDMADFLLRAMRRDGRAQLTIALGCTGGRHRSVAVTEKLASALAQEGWLVSKRHREIGGTRVSVGTGTEA